MVSISSLTRKVRIPDADVQRARDIDLRGYLASLGSHPVGGTAEKPIYKSPFRQEKNASFTLSYYQGRWRWKDWGTGHGGDIIQFAQDYYGCDFHGAVERLVGITLGQPARPPLPPAPSGPPEQDRAEKERWVREVYPKLLSHTPRGLAEEYFCGKGVCYHPQIGCAQYAQIKEKRRYVAIPLPYPAKVRGLECREVGGDSRRTLGTKTLWVLKREPERMLVTESILDALAGEVVLGETKATLVAINGVGNTEQLSTLFGIYKPREVLFALDADDPGRVAQKRGVEIAKPFARVSVVQDHTRAGVKDLHKLLLQQPVRTIAGGRR